MPPELSPEAVVRLLQQGDPAARARLEAWCAAPVRRLVDRLLAPPPDQADRLARRTLRWLEMYLRSRDPAEFRAVGGTAFRMRLLAAAWRLLSEPAEAGPRPPDRAAEVPPSEAYHVRLFFRPHGAVGGDWFDVEAGDAGDVWVLVADVSGKGLPANLLASGLPHLWRTERVREGRRRGLPPGEVLAHLGRELEECLPDCVFVEATLGRFTPAGRATVASAGACPVVVRRGRVEVHTLGGPPLGLADVRGPRGERTWDLRAGDECLLATDGLFDQRAGTAGDRLSGRLPALLDEAGAPASLHEAVADGLRRALEAYGQDDDIAVVTVAFRTPEGRDVPV
jgi:hypothetical protein